MVSELGKFIKKKRLERELGVNQLGSLAGISGSEVSRIESGNRFHPSPIILQKLARVLRIDYTILLQKAGYLLAEPKAEYATIPGEIKELTTELLDKLKVIETIPIVGYAPATDFRETFELKLGTVPSVEGANFAVQVRGDCLKNEGILDGDIVFIKKQPIAKKGDLVLVRLNDETTLKFFYPGDGEVELRPANPKYKPIKVKQFEIIGIKIAILRK